MQDINYIRNASDIAENIIGYNKELKKQRNDSARVFEFRAN